MAACLLCRRVPRLHYLPGLRQGFSLVQRMHVKTEDGTDDQEKKRVLQHQEASSQGGYKLYYNPSSYYHSVCNSTISVSQRDYEADEECLSSHEPSVWQQSKHDSHLQHHPSLKKTLLLDVACNKGPEPKGPSLLPYPQKPMLPDPRGFMKCRPEYASMTLDFTQRPHPIEWIKALSLLEEVTVLKGSMKTYDVSQFLVELSRLHSDKVSFARGDQRFNILLRYSVECLHLFTDVQLLEVLQSFVWLGMPPSHTVLKLYEAELSRRANHMSLHQLLLAADLWRCIGMQVPLFLQHLYDSVQMHLREMGVPELVQLLYIIGEGRQCPNDLIRPLELRLMCHLQQLHPEEVGAVCLGLFKSQTSISEGTVIEITNKALSSVKEMGDFAIVNVMKLQRFSYLYHREWLEAMAQEVPQRAHRMGVQGLMHVVLACSALHYKNDGLLTAVAERIPSLLPHCRIKDIGKLLWAYGTLGFLPVQSPSFYSSLTEGLRQRKAQFQRNPQHLLTGLLGLAFVSHFPKDLIAFALSPDFVNSALKYQDQDLKKDLFTLDGAVGLELPQWTGPRLSYELKEEVTEILWKFAQSDVCQKPEVLQTESVLQDLLGGKKFVVKRMLLPHTRSIDLEVHFDTTGLPIPVNTEHSSPTFPSDQGWGRLKKKGVSITEQLLARLLNTKNTIDPSAPSFRVKPTPLHRLQLDEGKRLSDSVLNLNSDITESLTKPSSLGSSCQDSKGIIKVAVQVTRKNQHILHSQQLLGLHAMKRRHLKMTGFRVVELYCQEWFTILRKSKTEKLVYLRSKICEALQ